MTQATKRQAVIEASESQPATYRKEQVAKLIGISERSVERGVASGEIPGVVRVGKSIRFSRAVVDKFLQGETAG